MYTRKYATRSKVGETDALYYVSCDFGMGSASVKRDVLRKLKMLGIDLHFGQVNILRFIIKNENKTFFYKIRPAYAF